MNQTILIHHRRSDTFASIPHDLLEDERLSWRAKGIICYLLGKPPEWKARLNDIRGNGKDGFRSIRAGLKELRDAGYAKLVQVREGRRIKEWQWHIADSTVFSLDVRFEQVENEHVQNAYHSKKEDSKNDLSKKKSKESKGHPFASQKGDVSDDPDSFTPKWKPSPRRTQTKEECLKTIRTPKDIPSEAEFDDFMESNDLDMVLANRDMYRTLSIRKWHHWSQTAHRWTPIRDWRKYVASLNARMEEAAG